MRPRSGVPMSFILVFALVIVDRRRRILHRPPARRRPGRRHGQAAFAAALSWMVGFPAGRAAGHLAASSSGRSAPRSISTATSTRWSRTQAADSAVCQPRRLRSAWSRASPTACAGSMPRRCQAAADLRRIAAAACSQGRGACHRYPGLHDPDRRRGEQAAGPARPDRRRRCACCWRSPARSIGLRQIQPRARARNNVEKLMLWGLLGASTIAILTTVGIVLSMLFQTITFFERVPPPTSSSARSGIRASPPPAPADRRPVRPDPAARRHALYRAGGACWSPFRSG